MAWKDNWNRVEFMQVLRGQTAPFLADGWEIDTEPQLPFKPYFMTFNPNDPKDYPVLLRRIIC